ncbi:isopenicillin N synthase family oxygenase [Xylophilus rhododendri]|uniref:2-oxoglutarate-dependent ethylene/succinate-forming enzyme n=1 Tax=Xylophilus rhododendri TaxID=2697032 RepID=A0A857J3Z7_9BURK|nr:isopenicillin N synthase family oxygenase [Xylophilus rhododendri]QHI98506.1 isopenicillin N synthase family oxygenase [Xylophilus rhododendri]
MSDTSYAPSLAAIRPDAKEEIPVLDIGPYLAGEPGALERLGAEMRYALENIGFYFVVNHGIPQALIDGVFDAARLFHALPLEQKSAIAFTENNTGYVPLKGSTTRHSALTKDNKPNLVESFFIKRDLPADHPDVLAGKRFRGQNQWPEDLPEFRRLAMAYADAAERLGTSLLPLYAVALGLPADWFAPAFREPMYTLRLSHYPQQPPAVDDQFGLAPHTDTSFMTLLPQNKVQGLSVRLPNGKWIDAPALPGSFLVNGGDLMRRWTNDRFLATPHRVTNKSGQERYAAPFFMDCDYGWVMRCIPSCLPAGAEPSYPPITYAEYLAWYRAQNYAAAPGKDGVKLSAY